MASGLPKKTPTPRLLSREGLKPDTLLPSKFQREKFLSRKKEASTGGSILPRIGPFLDMTETRPKMPRLVKVCMESCPYFQLACPRDVYHMVPAGASAPVRIRFSPDENKDYCHELVCITARERNLGHWCPSCAGLPCPAGLLQVSSQGQHSAGPQCRCPGSSVPAEHPEVKLMNQGALDAPFTCIPSATKVGFCFKFAPEEGIIAAGGSQSVQISFSATVLGSFEEEFQFSVAGSPVPAILTIKGSVTAPSLHFDLPELDFGNSLL
ncbi:uncharacterized protein [Molothrus aeneus]